MFWAAHCISKNEYWLRNGLVIKDRSNQKWGVWKKDQMNVKLLAEYLLCLRSVLSHFGLVKSISLVKSFIDSSCKITRSRSKGSDWSSHCFLSSVSKRMVVTDDKKYVPGPKFPAQTHLEIPFFGVSPCSSVICEEPKTETQPKEQVCITSFVANLTILLE